MHVQAKENLTDKRVTAHRQFDPRNKDYAMLFIILISLKSAANDYCLAKGP